MLRRRQAAPAVLLCAGLVLAGCAASEDAGEAPRTTPTTSTSPSTGPDAAADAGVLLEEALVARADQDAQRFADLVSQAAASCADPTASRRLGEVSAIAGRWADSLAFARPKVQARTEAQLAEVDWDALIAACAAA